MPSKRGQIFLIGPHVFWLDERNLVTVVKSGHSGEMGAP